MLRRLTFLTSLLMALCAYSVPASAQVDRIAAVVNDEVITIQDLDQRIRLALMMSNLPDGQEVRRRVIPQVLRKMIDEKLQMQEANRLQITVGPTELQQGIATLEHQNGMPAGGFAAMLQRAGIDFSALRDQIHSDLTWYKLSARVLRPNIRVGEEEINDRLQAITARQGRPEYLLGEIFLAVDSPKQDEEMRALGERLIEQIRAGAPFQQLARQFSQSATAANGGSTGWIGEDTMESEVAAAVANLEPNRLAPLIRTPSGYYIVAMMNRRIAGTEADPEQAQYDLAQMILPVPPGSPPKEQLAGRAQQMTANVRSCKELVDLGNRTGGKASMLGKKLATELPNFMRATVERLPENRASPPIDVPEGLMILMVCDQVDTVRTKIPSRDAIRQMIESERMDMMGRRYLRDLRRQAFVDVRI